MLPTIFQSSKTDLSPQNLTKWCSFADVECNQLPCLMSVRYKYQNQHYHNSCLGTQQQDRAMQQNAISQLRSSIHSLRKLVCHAEDVETLIGDVSGCLHQWLFDLMLSQLKLQ